MTQLEYLQARIESLRWMLEYAHTPQELRRLEQQIKETQAQYFKLKEKENV